MALTLAAPYPICAVMECSLPLYNEALTLSVRQSSSPVPYPEALDFMEQRCREIYEGGAPELLWFLEHPPLYTAGTSAKSDDLVDPDKFPVFDAGRGGQYTYHGPGQRVVYVMANLAERGKDIRCFVSQLEGVIIDALAEFGVMAERREGRVGVWVVHEDGREEKIAALGVRVRRWVSFHGISINVDPNLSHFGGIVPCGIAEHGVTSLRALGLDTKMAALDAALLKAFGKRFGPIEA